MLLAGERDVEAGAVSFRFRDGTQVNGVPVADAVSVIVEWVRSRRNESPTKELVEAALGEVETVVVAGALDE
jgi:threonyl-tRNA synthetase